MKSFTTSLALVAAIAILVSCSKPADNPVPVPTVTSITPVAIGFGENSSGVYDATVSVPYTGGNGLDYPAGQPVASTGITGFTMTLLAGKLTNGAGGNLLFNFKGTTTTTGVTFFDISFGGQSAKVNVSVSFQPQVLNLETFNPESGTEGDIITLTGTKFDVDKTKNTVQFGAVKAVVVSATATKLEVIVPEGAKTSKITVGVGLNTTVSDEDFSVFKVYVAGQEYDASGKAYAKYWINSVGTNLPLDETTSTKGNAIAVVGNDIYVAGEGKRAMYWKNGVAVKIGNGVSQSSLNAIVIVNNDVYVAGYEFNASAKGVAKYWKNGVAVTLTDGTKGAEAKAMVVSGNDVYVAGYDGFIAKVWKNGTVLSTLTDGSLQAQATGITLFGIQVYVAGYDGNRVKYWKDGTGVILTNGSTIARSSNIIFSKYDGSVVFGGFQNNERSVSIGTCWSKRDDQTTVYSPEDPPTFPTVYNSIAIGGNNEILAVGVEVPSNGKSIAKYWKEGKAKDLSTTQSSANAILLAP
jgi:hypothetical protein